MRGLAGNSVKQHSDTIPFKRRDNISSGGGISLSLGEMISLAIENQAHFASENLLKGIMSLLGSEIEAPRASRETEVLAGWKMTLVSVWVAVLAWGNGVEAVREG